MRFLILFAFFATFHSTLGLTTVETCGGLLESDAGEFEFPPEEILDQGQVCVWIVKLISRQAVQFNLTQLGEGLTVSLYEEHSSSKIATQPTRLNSSDVGITVDSEGQTLVVVLTQKGFSGGFAFTWNSLELTEPKFLTTANYINEEDGYVFWNRFNNREKLTLSPNVGQSESLDIEVNAHFRDCSLANYCQCSYVALYEITSDGFLREVSIACGRTSQVKVKNLFPNILAFVYLNSSHSVHEDFSEIKWTVSKLDVPSTTTPTTTETSPTTTTTSTTPWPIVYPTSCGGTVEIGRTETVIEYFPTGGFRADTFCVWTLLPTAAYSGLSLEFESSDVDYYYNGVTIYNWDQSGIISTSRIYETDHNTTITFYKPFAALAFSSWISQSRGSFRIRIRGIGNMEVDYNHRNFVFKQDEGAFSYPEDIGLTMYKPNERMVLVIQPPIKVATEVAITSTDLSDDFLMVYKLNPYRDNGYADLVGRTTGSRPEGDPSVYSNSYYPRLLLFNSNDNSLTGKGFSVTWKVRR